MPPNHQHATNAPEHAHGPSVTGCSNNQAADGLAWIKTGCRLFTDNPLKWALTTLAWLLAIGLSGMIPIAGQLVSGFLSLAMLPGLLYAAYQQDQYSDFRWRDTLRPIKPCAMLFVLTMIAMALILALLLCSMNIAAAGQSTIRVLVLSAMITVAMGLFSLAFWFAAPLMTLGRLALVPAIQLSFQGCLKNIAPLSLYGVLVFGLLIIGVLLFGLGLLVALPVIASASYAAYQAIYPVSPVNQKPAE